jgi:FkbM family methyltransferase
VNPLGLFKAEYVFRPSQVLRRLFAMPPSGGFTEALLPWGAPIRVRTDDAIGHIILMLGVLDLPVTEALLRLADPGEIVVDAGANIGCMTAALARAVGSDGTVWSFEPHPELFEELQWNVRRWSGPSMKPRQLALSSAAAVLTFETPSGFEQNRGLSRATTRLPPASSEGLVVSATTLDTVFETGPPPAVVKIDVEGHELEVLTGGARLFAARRIRDCVFEEHQAYPTPVTSFLEQYGYKLYAIGRALTRPLLRPPMSARSSWEATSYLATTDPARAEARFAKTGWQALR